jgi:hypothetical protein
MARPGPARPGADQPAGALFRACRRRGQVPVGDRQLHQHVEPLQRFIMGDVLLGLIGQKVRQGKARGLVHGRAPDRLNARKSA